MNFNRARCHVPHSRASGASFLKKPRLRRHIFRAHWPATSGLLTFGCAARMGSPIWVSISCMPMCDEAGATVAIQGLFSDISKRKRAEEALRKSEKLCATCWKAYP